MDGDNVTEASSSKEVHDLHKEIETNAEVKIMSQTSPSNSRNANEARMEYQKMVDYIMTLKGTVRTMRQEIDRLYDSVALIADESRDIKTAMRLMSALVRRMRKENEADESDFDTDEDAIPSSKDSTKSIDNDQKEKKRKRDAVDTRSEISADEHEHGRENELKRSCRTFHAENGKLPAKSEDNSKIA